MTRIAVSVIGGAQLGAVYALVALGIVLAFRGTGTFNFAHGQFMLIPAFILGAWQARYNGATVIGILIALAFMGLFAALFYRLVLQRAIGLAPFLGVIATLGLAAALDGGVLLAFGSPTYQLRLSLLPAGRVKILGANFNSMSLILMGFALFVCALVALTLRGTRLGLQVRAAGQSPALASQSGINVRRVYAGSWATAGVLAGIAGIVYGTSNLADASITDIALAAFPALVIGGLDSIDGAIVGGLIVGVLQGFTATYLGGQVVDVITYAMLLVFLLIMPSGLLGTRDASRV